MIERMIPGSLLATHETRLRARTLVVGSLGLTVCALVINVVRMVTAPPDLNLVITFVTVLALGLLPYLQYKTGSYRVPAGLITAFLLVTLPTYIILLGVFPAPALLVYPVVPVIAAFFLGPVVGLLSAVALAGATLVLGWLLPNPDPELLATLSRTFIVVGALATLMSAHLAWVYEGARKQAEAELRALNAALEDARQVADAANRSKTEFLRHVSHELRTPLNSILGHGELLREELAESGQDSLVADVTRISDAGQHLLALINELLDISRIEAGAVDLRITAVDLHELVTGVADTMRPLASAQHSELKLAVAGPLPPVASDARRLRQVLLNLVSNACKFTERGEITVGAAVVESSVGSVTEVHLWVRDTGIGMTAEQLTKIFEPFVQVDSSPERREQGSGLGLSITRRLVELLGGRIAVTSEYGRGTEFGVWLPLRSVAEAAADR